MQNAPMPSHHGHVVSSIALTCPGDGSRLWLESASTLDHRRSPGRTRGDAPVQNPLIGQCVGPYRLLNYIGAGAMGIVFRAKHTETGGTFALKVLRAGHLGSAAHVKRFELEARAARRVCSDGVVTVSDIGTTADGRPWIAMELLEGPSLADLIPKHGFPIHQAVGLGIALCKALEAIHGAGVIHRDLKPGNVVVLRNRAAQDGNGGDVVKVVDFGLARILSEVDDLEGCVVGSPPYMAREQVLAEATTALTDVYALGCVLFELFCGQSPFEGPSVQGLLHASVHADVPRLSEHVSLPPAIRTQLDSLLARCLEKAPEARPASARLVRRHLERVRRALPPSADRAA